MLWGFLLSMVKKKAATLATFTILIECYKNSHCISKNSGTIIPKDHSIYPKNDGILTPFSSAIALIIMLGALPM